MRRPAGLLLMILAAAAGCDDGGSLLLVDVKTDLVPSVEFDAAEVTVDDGRTAAREVMESDRWVEGVRVAELTSDEGQVSFHVRLLLGESEVLGRDVQAQVAGTTGVTVVLTRDCRQVDCSDDVATACLAGTCVSNSCIEENPEDCADPECTADADCPSASACGTAICSAGTCLYDARPTACGAEEQCDPEVGCASRGWGPIPTIDWLATSGGDGVAHALVTDDSDNLYVGGSVLTPGDFDGMPITGRDRDAFIASYTPAGTLRWVEIVAADDARGSSFGDEDDTAESVFGLHQTGTTLWVTGTTGGNASVAGLSSSLGGTDPGPFVASMGLDGTGNWLTRFPSATEALGTALHEHGELAVVGRTAGPIDFEGTPIGTPGEDQVFFLRMDPVDGSLTEALSLGATGQRLFTTLLSFTPGSLVIGGNWPGDDPFGNPRSGAGHRHMLVGTITTDGVPQSSWPGLGSEDGRSRVFDVALDDDGNYYVAGATFDALLGTTPRGDVDAVVLSLTPAFELRWVHRFGSVDSDEANAIQVLPDGTVIASGEFEQLINVPGGALYTPHDYDDVYVLGLASDTGDPLWAFAFGDDGDEEGKASAVTSDGAVYIAGASSDGELAPGVTGSGGAFLLKLVP